MCASMSVSPGSKSSPEVTQQRQQWRAAKSHRQGMPSRVESGRPRAGSLHFPDRGASRAVRSIRKIKKTVSLQMYAYIIVADLEEKY